MNLTVRPETPTDFEAVFAVNRWAFGQENEAKLVEAIRLGHTFIPQLSLVAVCSNQVVGHVLFSTISIVGDKPQRTFESLALAPVAIKPPYQRQGIGRRLIQTGLDHARGLGYTSVMVLGHAHYYPKFGFIPADHWHIKPPFDVPREVFMALELVPGSLHGISGTVRYPAAFEAV